MNHLREHLSTIEKWKLNNPRIVIARVIKTWGSAPRPVGSFMLINANGDISGSVSGGCVEGAVIKKADELFSSGKSTVLEFGITNESAWSVGLACGGQLTLLMEFVDLNQNMIWSKVFQLVKDNIPFNQLTEIKDAKANHRLSLDGRLSDHEYFHQLSTKYLREKKSEFVEHENHSVFVQHYGKKEQLIIIGAAHITVDLVKLGNMYGFETIIIDPRGYFIEHTVFDPAPDQLIDAYPSEVLNDFDLDAYTYVAVLSHDPKIDDNAFEVLLDKPIAYIGALGSRKSHNKRVERLVEAGITEEQINRIKAPIGVPIKAKTAREIALSIMSEIIEAKNQYL